MSQLDVVKLYIERKQDKSIIWFLQSAVSVQCSFFIFSHSLLFSSPSSSKVTLPMLQNSYGDLNACVCHNSRENWSNIHLWEDRIGSKLTISGWKHWNYKCLNSDKNFFRQKRKFSLLQHFSLFSWTCHCYIFLDTKLHKAFHP